MSRGISRGIGRGIGRGITEESRKINDDGKGISKGIILELITENPKISVSEIAETAGLSIKGVEKNIRKLKEDGKLSRTTNTKSGEWVVLREINDNGRGISRGINDDGRGINDSKGISKGIILELITENPKISVSEIAETVGLSIKGVEKNIRQLKEDGKLSRTTNTKSGEWIILNRT